MKKRKVEILSADSLVSMAKASHQKVMREAEEREKKHKQRIADLGEKEKGLKVEIAAGKELLEKMTVEFEILEKEKKEAIAAELKESGMSEDDVKSGKITMREFVKLKEEILEDQEEEDSSETEEIPDPLEKATDLVRAKGEEIIRLEFDLYSCQSDIFSLMTQPVKSIRQNYRNLTDMLDYQLEGLTKEGHSSQNLKAQVENQLNLIEKGASVASSGYVWASLTLKQAFRLRLDPVFPKEHIPLLLEKLDEIEPGEDVRLTITYHQVGSFWPGDPIEVREEL